MKQEQTSDLRRQRVLERLLPASPPHSRSRGQARARAYQRLVHRLLRQVYNAMINKINGVAGQVGRHETAFSYRGSTWSQVIVGVYPDPANAGVIRDWCVNYWEALHPYSAGGAYVNSLMEEGESRVQTTYRDNYPRLAAIKAKYDPTNFFPHQPKHQASQLVTLSAKQSALLLPLQAGGP